jgi:hypothetical protein
MYAFRCVAITINTRSEPASRLQSLRSQVSAKMQCPNSEVQRLYNRGIPSKRLATNKPNSQSLDRRKEFEIQDKTKSKKTINRPNHIPLPINAHLLPGNRLPPTLRKRSPRLQHRRRLPLNRLLILGPPLKQRSALLRTDPFALVCARAFAVKDKDAEGGVDCVAGTFVVSARKTHVEKGLARIGNVQPNQPRRQINRRPRRSQSAMKGKE